MIKPEKWEETQSITGDIETLKLGGHICKITGVRIEKTKSGAEVLVIAFDIAEGDEQAGFYQRRFNEAIKKRADAKWQGIYRQLTGGSSTAFFKGMIENIEKSNEGYDFVKANFDEQTLVGKYFGGVFGREQYQAQDGSLKFYTKCVRIRTVQAIKEGIEPPKDKLLITEEATNYFSVDIDNNETTDLPF